MKSCRILLAEDTVPLRALLEKVASSGLRYGWLRVPGEAEVPEWTASAQAQCDTGALRSVWVTAAGSVSLKPRRQPSPLRDLLREHFLGCDLVLLEIDGDRPLDAELLGWLQRSEQETVRLKSIPDDSSAAWEIRSLSDRLLFRASDSGVCAALRRPNWLSDDE